MKPSLEWRDVDSGKARQKEEERSRSSFADKWQKRIAAAGEESHFRFFA